MFVQMIACFIAGEFFHTMDEWVTLAQESQKSEGQDGLNQHK
jgi:hypothetical protein